MKTFKHILLSILAITTMSQCKKSTQTNEPSLSALTQIIVTDSAALGFPISAKATVTGSVTSIGNSTVTAKGICWSYKQNNSIANNIIKDTTTGTGISVSIKHIPLDAILYVRAFATNSSGTGYGPELTLNVSQGINPGGGMVDYKPNIYIYPKTKTQLQLSFSFPKGGNLIKSIPEYKSGWNVNVEPSGLIDKRYGFLFYESTQPDIWQKTSGWIVKKDELYTFFTKNMEEYGFKGQEIKDFTDYWLPRLHENYYIIYPQEKTIINSVITLIISQQPEQLLRLHYYIKGSNTMPTTTINAPVIDKSFSRTGYFITEWGVIL